MSWTNQGNFTYNGPHTLSATSDTEVAMTIASGVGEGPLYVVTVGGVQVYQWLTDVESIEFEDVSFTVPAGQSFEVTVEKVTLFQSNWATRPVPLGGTGVGSWQKGTLGQFVEYDTVPEVVPPAEFRIENGGATVRAQGNVVTAPGKTVKKGKAILTLPAGLVPRSYFTFPSGQAFNKYCSISPAGVITCSVDIGTANVAEIMPFNFTFAT